MATAAPMRPFHLAVIGLAFVSLHLLARAAADSTVATTTEQLASALPHDATLTVAGRPASSHHHRASSASSSTTAPDDAAPRRLDDASAAAREDTSAPATTAPAAPSSPARSSCPCVRVAVRVREAAVDDLVPAPGGITAAATRKALLRALPLLAVPFLPAPLAAVVALSSLTGPVRAGRLSDDNCPGLAHPICSVYRYLPDGTVDRTQPLPGLSKVCYAGSDERARSAACACGQRQGQLGHPLHNYCRVRTLEIYDLPAGVGWRVLPGHLPPVADPDAVVAGGGDVCYVEMEHLNHREGYYILCPVRKCPRLPFLCCPELPHNATVATA